LKSDMVLSTALRRTTEAATLFAFFSPIHLSLFDPQLVSV
jgi:hypothetical protein